MNKHQLSSMMIGGLSLLAVVSLIIPAYADLKDDKKEICSGYGGDWKYNDCKMENENVYSEYLKDVKELEEEKAVDEDINRYDVDVLCDASEDYEAHKEQCDKLYDSVEEDATLAFASSEEEEHCEDNDGNWSKEDKLCSFDDEDDQEEYDEKKYKHFANKPENRDNPDWEYDEEDG
jgi:hypothetical protein